MATLPFKSGGFNAGGNKEKTGKSGGGFASRSKKIFKGDLQEREYPHWKGSSWVRILPAHQESKYSLPYLKVPIVTRLNTEVVDPEFFGERSLFREVHRILKNSTDPKIVARRYDRNNNANGLRCWPRDFYIAWLLPIQPKAEKLALLMVGANEGHHGSPTELGHIIITEATKVNDDPSLPEAERGKPLYKEVTDIAEGNHLQIIKTGEGKGTRYSAEFSRAQTNISTLLEQLNPKEFEALAPLENILVCPTLDEQKKILIDAMGEEFFYELMPEFAPSFDPASQQAEAAPATSAPAETKVEEPVAKAADPVAEPVVETAAPAAVETKVEAPAADDEKFDISLFMNCVSAVREDASEEKCRKLAGMLAKAPTDAKEIVGNALNAEQKAAISAQGFEF